jgi:hypothetical protein
MATLSITPASANSSHNNTVTADIFVAAACERIFQALSDPKRAAAGGSG